jgi:predicted dehydrogenase
MIRFGIIGAGNIAHKFAKDIKVVDSATLVAVASRSHKKAMMFQKEHSIPLVFSSYEELFQSPEVDAIYIATPHNFHKQQAIEAIRHKKHVLCEKPIAVNETEWNEMSRIAKTEGVLLMEAMWTWFLPVYQTLHNMQQNNMFGNLLSVDIRFGYSLVENAKKNGRLLNPDLAGGSLLDIGVYPISVQQFFSREQYIGLTTSTLLSKTGVDLYTVMDYRLDNSSKTTVHLESAIDRVLDNQALFVFEKGTLVVPNFHEASRFQWQDHEYEYPHKSEGFEYQIESFCESIKNGDVENPVRSHQASTMAIKLMDAVRHQLKIQYPFE